MNSIRVGHLALVAGLLVVAGCTGSAKDAASPSPTIGRPGGGTTSPSPSHGEGRITLPVHGWHARLIGGPALQADTTTALAGRLYAVTAQAESPVGTSDLVRLDPQTGQVIVRSARAVAWQIRPVLADGLVWTVDAKTTTVLGFDPRTLTVSTRVRVPLPGSAEQGVSLASGGRLGPVVIGGGRAVAFVDPDRVRRISVDGLVSRVALSAHGERLYVVTLTTDRAATRLETLNPHTGRRLTAAVAASPLLGPLATSGGLWDTWAGGHGAGIEFRPLDDLSVAVRPDAGSSGGGLDVLPAISAGVAWLGGDRQIGCADPDTGVLRATVRIGRGPGGSVLGYVSGMTALAGKVYAIFSGSVGRAESGLIEMTPPAGCFTG